MAIGAMTVFMNMGWETYGGAGIVFISLVYAAIGLTLTNVFATKGLSIPAGVCATFVVCVTPLAIYGLQQWLGVWPDDSVYRDYHHSIKWHWLYIELATLAVGAIVFWKYKYPFLIMPLAIASWYVAVDFTVMLSGGGYNWDLRQLVSMYTGLFMLALAFWVDIRFRQTGDYAFWLYLVGVIAFWGGLSLQDSANELSKLIYFCINLVMIGVGVLLVRRVFVIFGALGSCLYIGHLAYDVFSESWLFPVVLTGVGLGFVYLGGLWQKHEAAITQKSRAWLPAALREMLEARA